ncbi:hypothetical protein NE848_04385 [Gramella jeungdoensis]|uniref:DUF3899 domain-containing protein n=1 Tax=Gramella jeungdoensis TaxID=708091 RepID=A0ABT0YZM9_9FLAO|nr:hypothetical protein [Gramella jeungdoensis]MCM8568603.1 hypothetical protein [Gramella jeungdoensis]
MKIFFEIFIIPLFLLAIPILVLQHRKKQWLKPEIVWKVSGVVALIGLTGLLFANLDKYDKITCYSLCTPFIYWFLDRFFKHLSQKKLERDFIAYVRFTHEVRTGWRTKNPHVKLSDKLITYTLLCMLLGNFFLALVYIN